jgi:predicted enzyme related to lactoylglutathione lyase
MATTTNIKIKEVAFYFYPVKDMAQARQFYEGVLGLDVEANYEERFVEYNINGQTLALGQEGHGFEAGLPGSSIWLEVENMEQVLAVLKEKNVPIKTEPIETPVCRMAVVLDPSGNPIGLHQLKAAQ